MPGDPHASTPPWATTSFRRSCCYASCMPTRKNRTAVHDFGKDILPSMIGRADMYAYDFQTNRIPGDPVGFPSYWRDVGTLDAYYEASMDLRSVSPELNLYNRQWPLRTAGYSDAPANLSSMKRAAAVSAVDSIVAGGSIVSGGTVSKLRHRPRRARPYRRACGGLHPFRQLRYRPPRQSSTRHSRQECEGPRRRGDRLRSGRRSKKILCHRQRNRGCGRPPFDRRYRNHPGVI